MSYYLMMDWHELPETELVEEIRKSLELPPIEDREELSLRVAEIQDLWEENAAYDVADRFNEFRSQAGRDEIEAIIGICARAWTRPTFVKPGVIVCVDWSSALEKRAAYVATVATRTVSRVDPVRWSSLGWSVESLVMATRDLMGNGSGLLAFDAPIGVPKSYFASANAARPLEPRQHFLDWLRSALRDRVEDQPVLFKPVTQFDQWSVATPFFTVLEGKNGLNGFRDAARKLGVELLRKIDEATGAKSMFAIGIPGQVALGAQALWVEIDRARTAGIAFKVWPFEGKLDDLLSTSGIVLGEIYPRAAYGTAFATKSIAKTRRAAREKRVSELLNAPWIRSLEVTLNDVQTARENEDNFDALVTATALLRRVIEEHPLTTASVDPVSEGGILCT